MFLGHFAVVLAAKAAPGFRWACWFGAQLADMLWPVFLVLGWESADRARYADHKY